MFSRRVIMNRIRNVGSRLIYTIVDFNRHLPAVILRDGEFVRIFFSAVLTAFARVPGKPSHCASGA